MEFHLDTITSAFLSHPYFDMAKKVKELGPGHPEDSVYTHLIQTADFVKEHISGNFITNPEAKKLFKECMAREITGVPYRDIVVLTGLLHDIGKILSFKEEGNIFPINQLKPDGKVSISLDHGFYGGSVIRSLLSEMEVNVEIIDHIINVVRLHLVPFDYYKNAVGYSLSQTIDYLKPLMQGHHIEVCLNAYGDIAHNPPLHECWKLIGKMFEDPHFYSEREYFIP